MAVKQDTIFQRSKRFVHSVEGYREQDLMRCKCIFGQKSKETSVQEEDKGHISKTANDRQELILKFFINEQVFEFKPTTRKL